MSSLRVDLSGTGHRSSGLTLLEVLICLVIVSTALVGLVSLENQDIRALNRSRKMTTAVMLARNMMAQIELAGFPEDLGEEEGDFQAEDEEERTPSAGFRWKRSIETATLGGRTFDQARRVKVTIIWEEGPREKHFDAVMYLTKREKK